PDHELESARALGLNARTVEVLDQRGIVDRFLEAGTPMQFHSFAGIPLDISDFPSRHPYGLALEQRHTERLLGEWVAELGLPIRRGLEVTGFAQDDESVDVQLSDGSAARAGWVGGRPRAAGR